MKFNYPDTKKVDQIDDYFGTQVADPYRWLEADSSNAEVSEWIEVQNDVTFSYLKQIPFRNQIKQRLEALWNYEKSSILFKEGNHYFFLKNNGLQNQPILYLQKSLDAEPEVLLDPNKLSKDGTVALVYFEVSNNGRYLGYTLSRLGSDWEEIYVIDVETRQSLDDKLEWSKFTSLSWQGDGFYYSRYEAPDTGHEYSQANEYQKVYYHKVGTSQREDQLVYEDQKAPRRFFYVSVTEDEHFLLLMSSEGTIGKNTLHVKDLTNATSEFIPIIEHFNNDHHVIDNLEDKLIILTNYQAPNKRLVIVDLANPTPDNWQTLVAEKKEVLQVAALIGGKLILRYLQNAQTKFYQYNLSGEIEHEIKLPTIGTVSSCYGKKEDKAFFYSFCSFTFPTTIYRYDIETQESTVIHQPTVKFNPEAFEVKQVFYSSKDGTKIPLFIVHKKNVRRDGNNLTYLSGYGSFNMSVTPTFDISLIYFLENGGVYAIPNLRGGGEYGEEWHQAGMLKNKQNVFDDFIAAAEYLIQEKYTCPEKLAIVGASGGGLLIGATMTQRPALFQVAIVIVGVLDMLRYHHFTSSWAWAVEYGCADNSKQEFDYLYQYSPVHNVKKGIQYPATLVMAATHDDRVVPAHSFKYIAELQSKQSGENPVMIRIDKKTGHFAGKPTFKFIEGYTDMWAFLFHNMGINPCDDKQL